MEKINWVPKPKEENMNWSTYPKKEHPENKKGYGYKMGDYNDKD